MRNTMEIVYIATLLAVFCFISPSTVLSLNGDALPGECMNTTVTIRPVSQPLSLGEGPHWDQRSQKLFFVDINDKRILSLDHKTGKVNSAVLDCSTVSFIIPVNNASDKFAVGCGTTLALVTWNGNDSTKPTMQALTKVDTDRNGTRWNDAKADSNGRLWGGTMALEVNGSVAANKGTFYHIGQDLVPKSRVTPVSISNGLDWNTQNTIMYYIDSPTRQIAQFDYKAADGTVSNRRVLYNFATDNITGVPDGMTVDATGNLWVATYGGSNVLNIDAKTGKLLCAIKMPASQITSAAFGGPLLDTLYITTAKQGLRPADIAKHPHSGAVFAIRGLKVRGKLPNNFQMRP